MLTLGALSFASPWLLLAGLSLPVLWWLLRLTPPSPKRLVFPAIRLLFGLRAREETPHKTPWWLIALRLCVAALAILGLAQPLWNAEQELSLQGPLIVVVDDGWASAFQWTERQEAASKLIAKADRAHRDVLLLTTAEDAMTETPILSPAVAAQQKLAALAPKPWATDRAQTAKNLPEPAAEFAGNANVFWLSDGLASASDGEDQALLSALSEWGPVRLLNPSASPAQPGIVLMLPPEKNADGLWAKLARPSAGIAQEYELRALDAEGRTLAIAKAGFAPEELVAKAKIDIPSQLQSRASRIAIEGQQGAGHVALIDDGGSAKPVGLASDNPAFSRQPMLGELYYAERALLPHHDVRLDRLSNLLRQDLAMIVLPDQTAVSPGERDQLKQWVGKGGMLVRFAGEGTGRDGDDLLPVRLRAGDRVLGGALSWSEPMRLAPFPETSPFAGLSIPKDVHVSRQVLAEPEIDLGGKTWARLEDGTPLVTAKREGDGYVVLFHIGGNAEWSDLPLSGLFVDMLERLIRTAEGIGKAPEEEELLRPDQTLDGYGVLGAPPAEAVGMSSSDIAKGKIGPKHPPGFYGPEGERRALNVANQQTRLSPLKIDAQLLAPDKTLDLAPWALLLALVLLLADFAIALVLRGVVLARHAGVATIAGALAFSILTAGATPTRAQTMSDEDIIAATETTHLAFVRTGAPEVDANSKSGLLGLTEMLLRRTSTDVGEPVGVDLEADDLTFYPLLYWPVSAAQRAPSAEAIDKLNRYMAAGGMIFFDTADQNLAGIDGEGMGPGTARLRELAVGLDIPPLSPIPADHVLTRAFYLLRDFPGRWIGGTLWVETGSARVNDGVSGVIVGANDYAAAWAIDDLGRPLYPATPGGERQREMAYRFGINLVMYALTGNYKADQVHVPAILERLGQ